MKFVTVRDLRTTPSQIWKQLGEEQEMVITNNGKPIALLTPLSDETLEGTLSAVRRARATEAVRRLQKTARERNLQNLSDDDIQAEIDTARKERKK